MKVTLRNVNLVFASKPLPEIHEFSIAFNDIVNYDVNGDVNLLYQGDIRAGDKVTVQFDQNNTGDSIDLFTKSKATGTYDDNVGLGWLRWVGTELISGTVEATAECTNIKLYTNDKDSTIIKTEGKVSGKVIIERA